MEKIQKYIPLVTLVLVAFVAFGVFTLADKGAPLKGITRSDVKVDGDVIVSSEIAFNNASTTNVTTTSEEAGNATSTNYLKVQNLYIGSGQRMDSFYNDTGYPLYAFVSVQGYDNGTASSSLRMNLFATTTSPSLIKTLYDFTALSNAINGSDSFLVMNHIVATSTVASTTSSTMMFNVGKGSGMVIIPKNGYMHFLIQQGDLLGSCTAGGQAGKCESATSTNRGIGDFFAQFTYMRISR